MTDDDEDLSSDDDEEANELNTQIAELKRILGANERILKGEDNDDLMKETQGDMDGLDDINADKSTSTSSDKKRKQREEDAKKSQQELDEWRKQEDKKFEKNLENNTDKVIIDINAKKNTVLQQQIANAFERGTNLQHVLKKQGASGDEVSGLINELQDKMQGVEDMMKQDEAQQNELLARRLDARRLKRKKFADKLNEVEAKLRNNETEKQTSMDKVMVEIQEELKDDLAQYEAEGELQKQDLKEEFEAKKRDKLAEFQERLKNARSDKNF